MKSLLLALILAASAFAAPGDTSRADTLGYGRDTCNAGKTCRYVQVKLRQGAATKPDTLSAYNWYTATGLRAALYGSSSSAGVTNQFARYVSEYASQGYPNIMPGSYYAGMWAVNRSPFALNYHNALGGYNTSQIWGTLYSQDSAWVDDTYDVAILQLAANDIGQTTTIAGPRPYCELFVQRMLSKNKKIIMVVPHTTRVETLFTGYNLYQAYCDSLAVKYPGRVFVVSHYLYFGRNTNTPDKYLDAGGSHLNLWAGWQVGHAWTSTIKKMVGVIPLRRASEFGRVVARLTGNNRTTTNGSVVYAGLDSLGDSSWTVTSTMADGNAAAMSLTVPAGQIIAGRQYRLYARYTVDTMTEFSGFVSGGGFSFLAGLGGVAAVDNGPDTLPAHTRFNGVFSQIFTASQRGQFASGLLRMSLGKTGSKITFSELALIELPVANDRNYIASNRLSDTVQAATVTNLAGMKYATGRKQLTSAEMCAYKTLNIAFDLFDTTAAGIDSISVWLGGKRVYYRGTIGSGDTTQHHEITVTANPDNGFITAQCASLSGSTTSSHRMYTPYVTADWRYGQSLQVLVRSAGKLILTNFVATVDR